MPAQITFRPGTELDRAFVFDSFVNSFSKSAFVEGGNLDAVIGHFLSLLDTWKLTIATVEETPDVILGWILYRDPSTVAYFLVHKTYKAFISPELLLTMADISESFAMVFVPSRVTLHGYRFRFRPWISAPISKRA